MQKNQYDVVVIGAGIAGLVAANYLAKEKRRVLLLEQNHQAGGLMSGFRRKGFYFDAGDQSFEDGGILFSILKQLNLYDENELIRVKYRFVSPGVDFVMNDLDSARDAFKRAFPHDAEGIDGLFNDIDNYCNILQKFMNVESPAVVTGIKKLSSIMKDLFLGIRHRKEFKEMLNRPFKELVEKHLKDEQLRTLLGNAGYKNMVLLMGAGFWYFWTSDYWYYRGGLQALANKFVDSFRNLGGEVRFKTSVEKIRVKDGMATGVITKKNEEINTDKIIYAGDYKNLWTKLLAHGIVPQNKLSEIENAPVSDPVLATYLGVNILPEELKKHLIAHHVFYFPEYKIKDLTHSDDPDLHKNTWLEITSPSIDNPELAPPQKSSIVLQTFTSFNWMDSWGTGGNIKERPEQYRALKNKVIEDMVETAGKVIPDLKNKIEYRDAGTPLSTIRFTMNSEGASAGWTYDPEKAFLRKKLYSFDTPVKNLFCAGHYTIWPGGVPSAALSGKIVAGKV